MIILVRSFDIAEECLELERRLQPFKLHLTGTVMASIVCYVTLCIVVAIAEKGFLEFAVSTSPRQERNPDSFKLAGFMAVRYSSLAKHHTITGRNRTCND